jgi:glutathione S-transferase
VTAVLWHIEISHYNEKARWALDYKQIPYGLRTPIPGLHGVRAAMLTRGRQRRLPVLKLDGRTIGDSTAIIAALERYQPQPPIYPDDPTDRAQALMLEDYFDEQLAPALRRLVWYHTLGDTEAVVQATMPNDAAWRQRLMRTLLPVARPIVRADYNVNSPGAIAATHTIRAAMDRIESELQPSGYLVGDRFGVADLTAAALFTPLLDPPGRPYLPRTLAPPLMELREELTAREGGRWIHETYARHRGASAAHRAATAA